MSPYVSQMFPMREFQSNWTKPPLDWVEKRAFQFKFAHKHSLYLLHNAFQQNQFY